MNSPKTYEILKLAQKYEIDEYLSFNVFQLYLARENANTQSFHSNCNSKNGCPFETCFKPTVQCVIIAIRRLPPKFCKIS